VGWRSPGMTPLSAASCALELAALLAGPAATATAAIVSSAVAAVIARDGVRTSLTSWWRHCQLDPPMNLPRQGVAVKTQRVMNLLYLPNRSDLAPAAR
jgi:hypothetical protein